MRSRPEPVCIACAVLLILALSACKKQDSPAPPQSPTVSSTPTTTPGPTLKRDEATPEAVKKAENDLKEAADRQRRMRACLTFDDFEATVYREPFEGGKYIVNGDTPIANEKQLREFFEKEVKPRQTTAELILAQVSGMDSKWDQQQKRKLSYCVSGTFGSRYNSVVQQMASAAGEWEKVAGVDFIHDSSQDQNCGPANAVVVFDVRPVNVYGEYLARAFFPNEPRAARNVLIDESSFILPTDGKLQLVGILRHELGHTIGFRHEHTRPESGTCFEDKNWRPLTSYDAFSVMHYPQCKGMGDWSLNLTTKDKNGAACVYGPTPPFALDPTLVTIADCTANGPVTETFQPEGANGYIVETTETSSVGGAIDSGGGGGAAHRMGDTASDQQYRSILSFHTGSIPDSATILSAQLQLKRGTVSGTNPFTTHGSCRVDVHNRFFGTGIGLEAADFQAAATAVNVATLSNPTTNGALSIGTLNAAGRGAINRLGRTQFRIYCTLDDDDDRVFDIIGFYSGNNSTPSNRPKLIVTYQ
jgi:serine protease